MNVEVKFRVFLVIFWGEQAPAPAPRLGIVRYAESDHGLLAPIWAGGAAEALTGDGALIRAMLDAEVALARTLVTTGIAPESSAQMISKVARRLEIDPRELALEGRSGGNPVLPLVRRLRTAVADEDPTAAQWVHRGATSQDIMDTALMITSARVLDEVIRPGLARAAEATAWLAASHRRTVLAGRTLSQHAVPITFGLKAAGWLSGLLDADEQCASVRRTLPAQLGGAAGTLAALDEPDRDATAVLDAFAAETGLIARETPWHTVRTPVATLASALSLTVGACGKPALDVTMLAQTELGEVSGDLGGESSAMPQKRNPVTAVLLVAAAREAPSALATLHLGLLAENERPAGAWHAEWPSWRSLLRLAGGAATASGTLLAQLRPDADAMAATVARSGGALLAERLTGVLRHEFGTEAAGVVREAALAGGLSELLTKYRVADPAGYLGAAPEFVDRALSRYRSVFGEDSDGT
jgi:3-carboxy-cis,cis-muconate cycloisomerase